MSYEECRWFCVSVRTKIFQRFKGKQPLKPRTYGIKNWLESDLHYAMKWKICILCQMLPIIRKVWVRRLYMELIFWGIRGTVLFMHSAAFWLLLATTKTQWAILTIVCIIKANVNWNAFRQLYCYAITPNEVRINIIFWRKILC